jgi:hypothetical protein
VIARTPARPGPRFLAVLLFLLVAPLRVAPAGAEVITLDAGRDNTLYESATGNVSNGAGPSIFAGRTNQATGSIRRGLVWFDVAAAVPAGSTILAARLKLTMSQTTAGAMNVGLHRVSAAWGEGASDGGAAGGTGAPAQAGDATWKHRFYPGTLWANPGGDFAAGASATLSVDAAGDYEWPSTPGLVADVQAWLAAPADNHGWLLRGNEAIAPSVKKFESRESVDPAFRPALTIEYALPVPAVPSSWGRLKGDYH